MPSDPIRRKRLEKWLVMEWSAPNIPEEELDCLERLIDAEIAILLPALEQREGELREALTFIIAAFDEFLPYIKAPNHIPFGNLRVAIGKGRAALNPERKT